jgi:hypothetical protein
MISWTTVLGGEGVAAGEIGGNVGKAGPILLAMTGTGVVTG